MNTPQLQILKDKAADVLAALEWRFGKLAIAHVGSGPEAYEALTAADKYRELMAAFLRDLYGSWRRAHPVVDELVVTEPAP